MAGHGTFGWNELITPDTDGCGAFYGKLLGWTRRDMDMGTGNYTLFNNGAQDVGGMMKPPADGAGPSMWLAYVMVDDVDARTAKVEGLGGKVMKAPFDIPGVGRISIVTDPSGAPIGLFTAAAEA
ncbi:MAG TPA: VOC family protein [Alphaproteobacteria bacterium]